MTKEPLFIGYWNVDGITSYKCNPKLLNPLEEEVYHQWDTELKNGLWILIITQKTMSECSKYISYTSDSFIDVYDNKYYISWDELRKRK